VADCSVGGDLIDGIDALALLADKGYDVNELIEKAKSAGMQVVIPPKKNRLEQRDYDKYLYKIRHLVENAFCWIKQWRGIATRYAKNTASFLAAVQIRCITMWLKVLA
jgi:transposase